MNKSKPALKPKTYEDEVGGVGLSEQDVTDLMVDLDSAPNMKVKRVNRTKVLTSLRRPAIIERVNKLRKDGKMTKVKTKNNLTNLQWASLLLLVGAAGVGLTNLLGGSLTDACIASLLAVFLFLVAADIR